ncbi:hypothetical protein ACFPVS_09300 [Neisseria weixii]|nr:hypothetical protein [Neisseria weixii]
MSDAAIFPFYRRNVRGWVGKGLLGRLNIETKDIAIVQTASDKTVAV